MILPSFGLSLLHQIRSKFHSRILVLWLLVQNLTQFQSPRFSWYYSVFTRAKCIQSRLDSSLTQAWSKVLLSNFGLKFISQSWIKLTVPSLGLLLCPRYGPNWFCNALVYHSCTRFEPHFKDLVPNVFTKLKLAPTWYEFHLSNLDLLLFVQNISWTASCCKHFVYVFFLSSAEL